MAKKTYQTAQHNPPLPVPDVLVANCGTMWTFCPMTQSAKDWFNDNVSSESYQWLGKVLCVESRFAMSLLGGIMDAGFTFNSK